MKKILILGAGIYQVPLIKTAKRLGIYTIVASIPGDYPGFELADKVYYENTTDYAKILSIARREKIDGIITTGTDVAVITIGRVCDTLGLTGLGFKSAEIATDKLLMKSCYEKYGVRTARFRKIAFDDEDYADKLRDLEFPVMFKSVDSSGSRGITKVSSPEEFEKARNNVLENTRSNYFIVEEFIDGEEFGAQAFVRNGEVQFILPHGDYVFKGDTCVPVGTPFHLKPKRMRRTSFVWRSRPWDWTTALSTPTLSCMTARPTCSRSAADPALPVWRSSYPSTTDTTTTRRSFSPLSARTWTSRHLLPAKPACRTPACCL